MIERNMLIKKYRYLQSLVTERREQLGKLLAFMETDTEWLKSPASTKYHLCEESGLLAHTINVAETLLIIKNVLSPDISDESCVVVSFIHDMGKAGMPGKPQYLMNEPTERQQKYGYRPESPYRFNTSLTYLSIPVRSLYLAMKYITLTEDETQAIIYHDGQYVEDNRSCANKEVKLTLLLQYADTWSGFMLEKGDQPARQ
jgi:hypothetical protein